MSNIKLVILWMASLPIILVAGEPDLQQICKTWTGLDKSSKPKFLSQIQITLEPMENRADSEPAHANESQRRRTEAAPDITDELDPLPALHQSNVKALPVKGILRSTPIGRSMDGSTEPKVDSIEGVYYADLGILKFKRLGQGWFPVGDVHAVFNPSATEMCLVFSGTLARNPPLYLVAGSQLSQDIRSLGKVGAAAPAPLTTQNRFTRTAEATTNQRAPASRTTQTAQLANTREETQQIRQRYQQQRQALQQQISAATRARNSALVASLREQQKQLTAEYNRQMAEARARNTGGQQNMRQSRTAERTSPVRQQPTAAACPEHILGWVNEMERNGASLQSFNGWLELANLFRPTAFVPHFGKPFADLNDQELRELGTLIQLTCANDGSKLARGGLRIPLAQLLNRPTTWGTIEMGLAGMALDVAGDWSDRMQTYLNSEAEYPTIQAFEWETLILLRTLWPVERNPLAEAIPIAKSRAIERLIISTIEGYAAQMEQADPMELFTPLYNIAKMRYQGLFEKVLPSEQQKVQQLYIDGSLQAVEAMKDRFKRELTGIPDPRQRNAFTLEWWSWGYNTALKFFGDHMETESFQFWLAGQRERDWQQLKPILFEEIDANTSLFHARSFIPSISLYVIDEALCPTWREILEKQNARLEVLEREAFAVRVGEGPFGVDFPGAIYLNAVYRLDREAIARENRLLTEPMNDYFVRKRDNVLQQIYENHMREYAQGTLTNTTFVDPMLAYFAGSYHIHYPECMENPVRIKETSYYEMVSRNTVVEKGVASENVYIINGRHEPAFRAMGERPFSPENRDFVMNVLGPFVPQDIKDNSALLQEAVRGLHRAMQERPCTDPVIQQLDKNLLILFSEDVN